MEFSWIFASSPSLSRIFRQDQRNTADRRTKKYPITNENKSPYVVSTIHFRRKNARHRFTHSSGVASDRSFAKLELQQVLGIFSERNSWLAGDRTAGPVSDGAIVITSLLNT
jgi:hypothetical protein